MNFGDFVYLDADSPTGLRWKVEGGKGRSKHYEGDIAGSRQENSAWRIWLDGYSYKCHRIVYELFHKTTIPDGMVVDHMNQNPFDNKIDNLRTVTRKINSRNMKRNVNNKTGINGVGLITVKGKFVYAVAQWRDLKGNNHQKSFSLLKYGDNSLEMANEFRSNAIKELNSMGAEYSDIHGANTIPDNVKVG